MVELQTNFNVSPYYDDYSEAKQYYRILFRPATAVQARELTQLQTILQKQISRFGNSVYKDGTIIEGCGFVRYPNIDQIKFKDSNTSTLDFGILTVGSEDLANTATARSNNYLFVSNTTGVRAVLFQAVSGAESVVDLGSQDTNRAYVRYITSGNTGGVQYDKFRSNEQVDVYSYQQDKLGNLSSTYRLGYIQTITSNSTVNALGVGYGIHINPGIIYQKGFFLNTTEANFIIKEHSSNAAGIKVGFNTKEFIVKPEEDESLYDNSIGAPNFSAPGAHRLKLVPEPIYYDSANTQITVPDSFLPVLTFDNDKGQTVENLALPEYSDQITKLLADRTFEESGNYVFKPFNIDVTTHDSNTQQMYYTISSGAAYIDGYRVPRQGGSMNRKMAADRGITTESANSQAVTFNYGNYFAVRNFSGIIDIANTVEATIYSANLNSLSNNQSYAGAPTSGVAIANVNIRAVMYNTGSGSGNPGTPNAEYRVYFFNYRPKAGVVSNMSVNAKSIYIDGVYGKVYGDIVANGQNQITPQDVYNKKLVYYTGYDGVKRLTNNTGVNSTTFTYRTTQTQAITRSGGQGIAAFTLPGPDKYYYGTGTLSSANELIPTVYFASNTWTNEIAQGGRLIEGVTSYSNATHSNVTFSSAAVSLDTKLRVGSGVFIQYPGGSSYNTVTAVNSANSITVTPNTQAISPAAGAVANISLFYKRGTPVDFTGSGNTITISADRLTATVTLSIDPNTAATYSLAAQIPITRTPSNPIEKSVKKEVYVAINCASHSAGSAGPWGLGIPDVYKINKVYVGSLWSTTAGGAQDRTSWFTLDSGQRDSAYQHGQLYVKPAFKSYLSSSSRLFVSLNAFQANITSSKAGFFSRDSYNIDDANPTTNANAIATAEIPIYYGETGETYDLRNCIDLRPVFANTALMNPGNSTFGYFTVNPANNFSTIYYGNPAVGGLSIEPDSQFTYNVENYLPRIDSIIITKDDVAVVKQGIPSNSPKPPSINNSGIKIADIVVPPYPSLTFSEAE
jgi:hypothetical protein